MRTTNAQTRQSLRCAFEPRIDDSRAWDIEGYDGPAPKTCPSYTTDLPEVSEVAEARFYLHKGSLQLLVNGELHDGLRDGIAILEGAENDALVWAAENPVKR
jgi:hypothetical protein